MYHILYTAHCISSIKATAIASKILHQLADLFGVHMNKFATPQQTDMSRLDDHIGKCHSSVSVGRLLGGLQRQYREATMFTET